MYNHEFVMCNDQTGPNKKAEKLYRFHFCTLIPNNESPCNIYIFFKGKYIQAIGRNKIVPLHLISKMYEDDNFFFYISETELFRMESSLQERHSYKSLALINLNDDQRNIEKSVSSILKIAESTLLFDDEDVETKNYLNNTLAKIRAELYHPSFEWFHKIELDQQTKSHNCRVLVTSLIFLEYEKKIKHQICYNSLIIGTLINNLSTLNSDLDNYDYIESTLDYLHEKNIAYDQKIINIIKTKNPLHEKATLITTQKVYALFKYFDLLRNSFPDLTKKKSIAKAVDIISKQQNIFGKVLITTFNKFISKVELKN